ncbi:MAG TPA: SusC/RagA family TonB-linked outer membrane protein [Gemmatimonadaceae bacterium]|nr:SusC/RagA family TonB-linked outer membrane protein [Gemmatimonadaceae bacterium]
MKNRLVRTILWFGLAVITVPLCMGSTASAQDAGTITGIVVDAASRAPIPSVQMQIVGTTRSVLTGEDGRYRISGVRAGTFQLRALRLGYSAGSQGVTVTGGGTVEANFSLAQTAVSLEQVVTTATGEAERKREIGSAVGTLQPTMTQITAAQNVSQLLTGKVAGLDVQQASGTVGGGSRMRIRGATSVSLTNEPLIVVDGIRFNNAVTQSNTIGSTTIGVGGQVPSRFNDINPDDIETIEVLKGPAAAAQYGTAAANGVIQVTTKRGHSGKPRWTTYAEGGTIKDVTDYPANYLRTTATSTATTAPFTGTRCTLDNQTRGLCTQAPDSVFVFNPLVTNSPFRTGHRGGYGASTTGGSDQVNFYVSGNYDKQQGVFTSSLDQRGSGRANISMQLRDNWNLQLGSSYLADHLRLPQNDNNTLGIVSAGLLGSARNSPTTLGYLSGATPEQIYNIDTRQDINRFESSLNTGYQPLSWLTATFVAGLDYLNRWDNELVPPNKVNFGSLPDGQRTSNPYSIYNYTTNGTLSAVFTPFAGIRSTTKISGLFNKELVRGTLAFGAKLLGGTSSLAGASARFAVNEVNTDNKTISRLIREDLAWRDRVFLSAALRNDKNSAFGQDFGSINYPSFTLSWVVNEENFFPKQPYFSSLRLRAANGKSGQKPNFRDAITFFNAQTVTVAGVDVPGITVGGTGNPELRPEKSKETELGFDAGFFDERVGVEVTHYNKRTDDLLIAVPLPPSLGLTTTQFQNLGSVSNKGWEFVMNARVLDSRRVGLDFLMTSSTNNNNLITLGFLPSGDPVPPIVVNTQQQHRVGAPLGSYFQRSYTFNDANNDGIIARSEITLSDTALYLGNPLPTHQFGFTPTLTLNKIFTISAFFDHKGGYKLFNNTRRFRCTFFNCPEAYDKSQPLADQAAAIAASALGTDAGYIEDATFTKLRELTFTFQSPESMTRALGHAVQFSVTGTNLKTWTDYTGFDPEINSTPGANFGTSDFLTLPPTRNWTARITVNF